MQSCGIFDCQLLGGRMVIVPKQLVSPNNWCQTGGPALSWGHAAGHGRRGGLFSAADLGSWMGLCQAWGARRSQQHCQHPAPYRAVHPIPSGWHPQLLLSLFCFPVRALRSQSPLQSILSAMLWHCPHGGQIQPLLRLAERFSRVPPRADGTMGSNNSLHPSPQGYSWPPKCNVLSAPPTKSPAGVTASCSTSFEPPAMLQLLPTQLFQTENMSKELSRRETTSLSERGWLSILSQHPGWRKVLLRAREDAWPPQMCL